LTERRVTGGGGFISFTKNFYFDFLILFLILFGILFLTLNLTFKKFSKIKISSLLKLALNLMNLKNPNFFTFQDKNFEKSL